MILYLSGPITGIDNFKDVFLSAKQNLISRGYKNVINPAEMNSVLYNDATWDDYMKIDLELIEMADAVVMLDGWKTSRGCCMEHGYANGRDKLILEYNTLMEDSCDER